MGDESNEIKINNDINLNSNDNKFDLNDNDDMNFGDDMMFTFNMPTNSTGGSKKSGRYGTDPNNNNIGCMNIFSEFGNEDGVMQSSFGNDDMVLGEGNNDDANENCNDFSPTIAASKKRKSEKSIEGNTCESPVVAKSTRHWIPSRGVNNQSICDDFEMLMLKQENSPDKNSPLLSPPLKDNNNNNDNGIPSSSSSSRDQVISSSPQLEKLTQRQLLQIQAQRKIDLNAHRIKNQRPQLCRPHQMAIQIQRIQLSKCLQEALRRATDY